MFSAIQRIFEGLKPDAEAPVELGDGRIAAAALAVHAIAVDGIVEESEKARLRSVLQAHFELSGRETTELIEEARRRDLEAVDLYSFTSVLKRSLDEDARAAVVEMLWKLVYADGEVHEFEDNLIWRVAELLGVPSRERIRRRQRVQRDVDDTAGEG